MLKYYKNPKIFNFLLWKFPEVVHLPEIWKLKNTILQEKTKTLFRPNKKIISPFSCRIKKKKCINIFKHNLKQKLIN